MNFWQIFIRVVWWRPLPALGALWWQLTRRRVRARNRLRVVGASMPFAYQSWIKNVEKQEHQTRCARKAPQSWKAAFSFTLVVDARSSTLEDVTTTLRSIEQQVYAAAQVLVIEGEIARNLPRNSQVVSSPAAALTGSKGDFIVPVRAGDQLSDWALLHFAEALQANPNAALVYGDEDEIDANGGRRSPWFKPSWNEELFLGRDYVTRACGIRTIVARPFAEQLAGANDTWVLKLILHIIALHGYALVHVPRITAHVRDVGTITAQDTRVSAVHEFAGGRGGMAKRGLFDTVKVCWPLPDPLPLVSVIIPTRDKLDVLRPCVDGLLQTTSYDAFEVLIVDNGSTESATLGYLQEVQADKRVRVISYPHEYNYSAINNHAARQARGSFICLLNNDTEVVEPDWLTELMRYAVRSDIGAAGAKLLYPDGSIQHAGVVVGIGSAAGHAHRNLAADEAGYFCYPHVAQFVSAVTGACLLVDKRKFMAVGGLDEEKLAIAYNDVDLCLKLGKAGWRNVYVPHAVLIHHESKSRVKDNARSRISAYRAELQTFQERWDVDHYQDPLLNPNLDRSSETYLIHF